MCTLRALVGTMYAIMRGDIPLAGKDGVLPYPSRGLGGWDWTLFKRNGRARGVI